MTSPAGNITSDCMPALPIGRNPGARQIARCRGLDDLRLPDLLLCLEVDGARGECEPGQVSRPFSVAPRRPCRSQDHPSGSAAKINEIGILADTLDGVSTFAQGLRSGHTPAGTRSPCRVNP